jgi:2-phosphosulfolactate phosphatase
MLNIEVVLSPALLHLYEVKNKNVVVIDILRATSTICTAIHEGALSVRPVSSIDEALIFKEQGYIIAGERDGYKIEGFDLGNSPFECKNGNVKGEKLALTTTNGTKCITAASIAGASNVLCGSFLNINATSDWLTSDNKDIILLCAGWKDKINLEDSIFAGALANRHLKGKQLSANCDSAQMVLDLYQEAKKNLSEYLIKSSHYQRLSHLHHQEDMVYCLQENLFDTVVSLKNGEMLKAI